MNVYFFEPFESEYQKNFSNSEFNLNDISIFTIMKQKFPNYERDINAWEWLESILVDVESKKKIQFIVENWSDKLIEDIVNC
jgi:hypothetical protein